MATLDDEKHYGSLSRNELQQWCTKLGLPSMKSCRIMAEALRSHIQNHKPQLSAYIKPYDGHSMLHFAPSTQSEAHISSSKTNEGSIDSGAFSNVGMSMGSIALNKKSADSSSKNFLVSSQLPIESLCADQTINKKEPVTDSEVLMSSLEGVSHSLGISTPVEIYFSSYEGINLFVDLNSKPSDWIKKCKDEVYMVRNASHCNKGRFLRDLCENIENKQKVNRENTTHEDTGHSNPKEKTCNFGVASIGNSQETGKENDAHGNCLSNCSREQGLSNYANGRVSSESSQIAQPRAKRSKTVQAIVKEKLRKSKRLRSDLLTKMSSFPRRSPRLFS